MAESNQNITSGAKAQVVKVRILKAATRLFGAQGYEATSIQAIAEAVGVRKQSLLHHFPSKEELHQAVIEASVMHWRDELPKLLSHVRGEDRFSAMVTALLTFFQEDPNRARLMLREMLDRPEELRTKLREHLSPYVKLLSDYIRMGQTSGLIRPEVDPESYVVQVLMLIISTVATGHVALALVELDGEPNTNELVRLVREALFVNPAE
jgi:AcrR family transcriptional regulator